MKRSFRLIGLTALVAAGAFAQAPATRPSFVVASVKPNTSGSSSSSTNGSKGQVVMINQTFKRLIERAYNVKSFQVIGPDWMESLHFDVVAKYPPDTADADRMVMLQTLLEERFKLAVHRESKERQGYALVVAKGGFKLKPVEPGGTSSNSDGNGRVTNLTVTKMSMGGVADYVARRLSETVVDRTEIPGVYDFKFSFTTDDQNVDGVEPTGVPSLAAALQDNLGLRLQAQKVPVEFIVVDKVERVPIEN